MAKKVRRSEASFPGLDKKLNLRSRWEYMDQDYIDRLSDAEKEFLSNFNEEYYGGNFKHKGEQLHKTTEERRECYGRNNSRNRDLYGKLKMNEMLEPIPEQSTTKHPADFRTSQQVGTENPESAIVDLLDCSKSEVMLRELLDLEEDVEKT